MWHPFAMDLRVRRLAAVDGGLSCRAVAERFGVAPSTAIHWQALRRATDYFAPIPKVETCVRAGSRCDLLIFSSLGGARA